MKTFNGKAIYCPKGKAAEYSQWACNFYVGCSNGCTYCYCKKGILKAVMGMDKPQLKKCFKDEEHAKEIFDKEMEKNFDEIRKHGLFLSFTTDPFLKETFELTMHAINICVQNHIPIKLLTKSNPFDFYDFTKCSDWHKRFTAFGFTLTGYDELEPNASTNQERIEAMKKLHNTGFKTFASIEPIIDLPLSFRMICDSNSFCDLYKIGLQSGKKYDKIELNRFIEGVLRQNEFYEVPIYFKDSLLKQAGIDRINLPETCVDRAYNMFKLF